MCHIKKQSICFFFVSESIAKKVIFIENMYGISFLENKETIFEKKKWPHLWKSEFNVRMFIVKSKAKKEVVVQKSIRIIMS